MSLTQNSRYIELSKQMNPYLAILKMADDTLRAIIRIDKSYKPSSCVAPNFEGKILSKK